MFEGNDKNDLPVLSGIPQRLKASDKEQLGDYLKLGKIFFYGSAEQPKNHTKAAFYFEKASSPDNPSSSQRAEALVCLGAMLRVGAGVRRDAAKSRECYREAARLGNAKAKFRIAEIIAEENKDRLENTKLVYYYYYYYYYLILIFFLLLHFLLSFHPF